AGEDELSQRLRVGINDLAGLLVRWREHRLIAHAAPGLEVRGIGNVVILDLQATAFCPFAVLAEPDAGRHDGIELVAAQISRYVVVFYALRSRDSVGEHLQLGVPPPAN